MDILYASNINTEHSVGELSDIECSTPFRISLDEKFDDLFDLLAIMSVNDETSPNPYLKIKKCLGLSHYETLMTMSNVKRSEMLNEKKALIQRALEDSASQVYLESYLQQKNFLRSLKVPNINKQLLKSIVEKIEHQHVRERVQNFANSRDKTFYRMSGTTTGRLTVFSGPNILTLPSFVREGIQTQFPGGKVLQIDLTAAEPHLALLLCDKTPPEDIYEHIAKHVLNNTVTRKEAKLITLSALYGQSSHNLKKVLPKSVCARSVIGETREYFQVDKLRRIIGKTRTEDTIRNVLGRPIRIEDDRKDLMISYYLQSSIAECSILMFADFCKRADKRVKPYYVIHDALIFDADRELSNVLSENKMLKLSMGSWKFQAKVSDLKDN